MINNKCKFIFVTGGVTSSIGKGLVMASIASLLQSMGFNIALRKLDPYLNVDPGTMSPMQHGEVFVTNDGAETDLDLGHYERFTGIDTTKDDSTSAGKIYLELINNERKGYYLGKTVQVIPHVTNLIKDFIYNKTDNLDFLLCEIGGTVGDIEGQPFFEAIRQVAYEIGKNNVAYVHVTLLPYIDTADEIKTKPTQHSVKALNSLGIQPDVIVCRTNRKISSENRNKIALFCNVPETNVIEAADVKNIYSLPIEYKNQNFDELILKIFNIKHKNATIDKWLKIEQNFEEIRKKSKKVKIGIVGKYAKLEDSYKSVIESIKHAGFANNINTEITIINAREKELDFSNIDGILIPGGFGIDGIKGKLAAIKYARENNIPLLGICLGFQLAVIEFAQNVLKLEDANSTEFFPNCKNKVIAMLTEWQSDIGSIEKRNNNSQLGGTMRLGAYECIIKDGSKVSNIYNSLLISERHRHRYEVNSNYINLFEEKGMKFTGYCKLNNSLPEILELENHPWFIGAQFHPEFKSRIFDPHPLFKDFIKTIKTLKEL
jgi:CTP synthase